MKILITSLLLFSFQAFANCLPEDIIEGEYLVRVQSINDGYSIQSHNSKLEELKTSFQTKVIHNQALRAKSTFSSFGKENLPPSLILVKDASNRINDLLNDPSILSIENNCRMNITATPDDTSFLDLWAHEVIQSEAAWDISTGSENIIIAISDTGIDVGHEDLKDNIWINEAEKNGQPGVDDDGNGYIDDINGYDFVSDDANPSDGHGHGTHVAGTAGGKGNNGKGVVGVVWNTKMMALKGLGDNGGGTLDSLLASVYYAADNGAHVLNCSWGGQRPPQQSERDAFQYAISKGVVPVVAAGNNAVNANGFSPAAITAVLTVGASTPSDARASFSNYGNVVDVMAPGTNILSTWPKVTALGKYKSIQGTSMAAPHVAGLAALALSINPNLGVQEVMDMIINTGDLIDVTDRDGNPYTYPRINVLKLAEAAHASLPVDPIDPPCVGESCDDAVGSASANALPQFNSNGCSYALTASSGASIPYFLLLPLLLLFIRRRS